MLKEENYYIHWTLITHGVLIKGCVLISGELFTHLYTAVIMHI